MSKLSVMLIAVFVAIAAISQTSAQLRICPCIGTSSSILRSLLNGTILSTKAHSPKDTILATDVISSKQTTLSPVATLPSDTTRFADKTLSPDVTLSSDTTLSSDAPLTTDATLSRDVTLPTETTLSRKETVSSEATRSTESTLSADSSLSTESTLSTESISSATTKSSIPITSSLPVNSSVDSSPNVGQCLTPLGKDGLCVTLHQCASIINLLRKQPLLEEDRLYLKSSQCGNRNRMVLVCCPDQQESASNEPAPSDSAKLSLLPRPGKCGKMSTNRLYGGYTTEFDAYTWSALLEYSKGKNGTGHYCGGTLINDRYVLTAAHCVVGYPETWTLTRVRLGEWDTSTENECNKYLDYEDCPDPHVDVSIETITPHEKFVAQSRNGLYDIALIRLASRVISTDFIEPICLPLGENKRQAFHSQSLDLVGWGANPGGLWNNIKQRSGAAVIPLGDCREKYAKFNVDLQDTQFCVEGRLINDTCRTDSGGAAVGFDTPNKGLGSFYLAGIQSFGPCWLEGYPSVFTRVSEYLDWILENIHQ